MKKILIFIISIFFFNIKETKKVKKQGISESEKKHIINIISYKCNLNF